LVEGIDYIDLDPKLMLNRNPIPVVKSTNFLGVVFDRLVNFRAHIKYLR
jgi:hypothetical protein